MKAQPRPAADALLLGGTLLLVLAWDLSGADLALSALAGGEARFPLRASGTWASRLHEAGRWLAGLMLAWQAAHALGPQRSAARLWTLLATLATLVAVPLLKRASATSCPWDVLDFGGPVPYVPHLWLWVRDGARATASRRVMPWRPSRSSCLRWPCAGTRHARRSRRVPACCCWARSSAPYRCFVARTT
jgi:hypothetical protein